MPYRQTIAAAYDAGVEEEYNRLLETPLREAEYQLIIELLDEYIPNGSTVIDIGSGPGRYAEHLLLRNCKVGVVDLSAKSLKAFSDRMKDSCCQQNIIFNQVSCATQLNWIPDNSADAILLMGPLYHLINDEHRNNALTHCNRILKPRGYLFTVFLSPFPAVVNISESIGKGLLFTNKELFRHIRTSNVTHTHFQGFEVPQFRCWPSAAKEIMILNSFETIRIRNIEGEGSFIPENKILEYNTPEKKNVLIHKLRTTSENEATLGITHQFILVSKAKTKY
jgi:ubiquinone/menaquinone biosynthesis C-methylase UbiE